MLFKLQFPIQALFLPAVSWGKGGRRILHVPKVGGVIKKGRIVQNRGLKPLCKQ